VSDTRILWLPTSEARHFGWDDGSSSRRNPSGIRVDPDTALQSTVVLACARVLAESVAGLPLHLLRRLADGGKEIAREHPLYGILHDAPNPWQTSFEWREQAMLHLCLHGNAYSEIRSGAAGAVTELWPLHPSRMRVEQIENGRLRYKYREENGAETAYTQDQIMHLRWLSDDGIHGMVPVELARDAIGLARACEIHGASFFGNGARPGVVLSTDNTISAEAAEQLRNNWERMHRGAANSSRTAVLTAGLKPVELGGNNQEAQFLEARRFQVEEVCRLYRVPPHLVGDLTRSSFSNIEQQSIDFVQHTLLPWLRRFETSIVRDLVSDPQYFAEFDTRGLLRGDAAARASYYQTLWNLGVASINEIRRWENLDPVDGGDTRFVQLNMQTLDSATAMPAVEPQDEPAVEPQDMPVDEPTNEPPAEDEPQVAEVSLNGAQITGLLEILNQVALGLIDKSAAKALLLASFPTLQPAIIDAILAGTATSSPVTPEPEPEQVMSMRAMTISIDYDRTFTADPRLWGEFAKQSAAAGNRVVMVSRRPDTAENQAAMAEALGEYIEAFSDVLLVGETMKDEAAKAAGIEVDVWIDDSPQFIRSEDGALD
jgi:HK97 family phage portal protein